MACVQLHRTVDTAHVEAQHVGLNGSLRRVGEHLIATHAVARNQADNLAHFTAHRVQTLPRLLVPDLKEGRRG